MLGRACPEFLDFQVEIVDRYPLEEHPDSPLQPQVVQFCFPGGIQLSSKPKDPTFFSFVLTDSTGVKLYGNALTFYEGLSYSDLTTIFVNSNLGDITPPASTIVPTLVPKWAINPKGVNQTDEDFYPCYTPKCIFTISHYPFFRCFNEFLTQIYRTSFSLCPVPLERYICNFVSEIPLPPCGKLIFQFSHRIYLVNFHFC